MKRTGTTPSLFFSGTTEVAISNNTKKHAHTHNLYNHQLLGHMSNKQVPFLCSRMI